MTFPQPATLESFWDTTFMQSSKFVAASVLNLHRSRPCYSKATTPASWGEAAVEGADYAGKWRIEHSVGYGERAAAISGGKSAILKGGTRQKA
jgi:hypothetical protein